MSIVYNTFTIGMSWLNELSEKTNFANVGAFIIAVVGLGASIYYGKWEIAGTIIGGAVAYLFKNGVPVASTT